MSEPQKISNVRSKPNNVKFVAGGNVQAKDGYYISREADNQLLELCRQREYSFVLAPRQLGKSSLMNMTAETLLEQNIKSVIIDPSPRGFAQIREMTWYKNLMYEIAIQLEIEFSFELFKKKYGELGATKMLELFFSEVVLREISEPVVIFIDEIDTTINLPFKDDFFASIRYFYQLRSRVPEFHRLTFVLIGVATPGDLISDSARTPFNLGERIDLRDFTLDNAMPLARGLKLPDENSREVLEWIMQWTNGHPYLTMSLCKAVADRKREFWTAEDVNQLVKDAFLGENIKENNLLFVRDMLTERLPGRLDLEDGVETSPDTDEVVYEIDSLRTVKGDNENDLRGEMLTLYQSILRGNNVRDDEYSVIKSHLKLSGIVQEVNGFLSVRNPIYAAVFDEDWINEHMPETWVKLQYRTLRRNATFILSALVLVLLATTVYALYQSNEAAIQTQAAMKQKELADRERQMADEERQNAENSRNDALQQKQIADDKSEEANKEKQRAEESSEEANKQKQIAEEALKTVQEKEKEARLSAERERQFRQEAEQAKKIAEDQKVAAQDAAKNLLIANEKLSKANEELDFRKETEQLHRDATFSTNPEFAEGKLNSVIARYEVEMPKKQIGLTESDRQGKADAYYGLATVYQRLRKSSEQIIEKYTKAASFYREAGDSFGRAKAITGIGSIYAQNDVPKAIKYYEGEIQNLGDDGGKADLQKELADMLLRQRSYDDALKNSTEALQSYREAKDKRYEGETLELIAKIYEARFAPTLSEFRYRTRDITTRPEPDILPLIQAYEELLKFYAAENNNSEIANTLSRLGNILVLFPGRRDDGIQYLNQAQEKYESIGDRIGRLKILEVLADAYKRKGDREKAIQYRNEALTISQNAADETASARNAQKLLEEYSNLTKKQEALQHLSAMLKDFEQHDKYVLQALALEKIGNIYLDLGDTQKAIDRFKDAARIYQEKQPDQGQEARILKIIAKTYNQTDDKKNAIDYYTRSRDIYAALEKSNLTETYGYADSVRLTYVIGEIHYTLGNRPEAKKIFEEVFALNVKNSRYWNYDVLASILQTTEKQESIKFFDAALEKLDAEKKRSELVSLSEIYLISGFPDVALDYLNKALDISPLNKIDGEDSDSSLRMVGEAYLRNGKREKALEIANALYDFYQKKKFKKITNFKLYRLASLFNFLGERKKASELFQWTEMSSTSSYAEDDLE